MSDYLLSILIWLPIFGGVGILFFSKPEQASSARWVSLGISLLVLALSIPLWTGFDSTTAAMQFVEKADWITRFNIHYNLGVDCIAMPLILHGRRNDWGVCGSGCVAFLPVLGSDADTDVFDYRYLGRT
jgi:NADH-quinone oxidoreductase subunit M